MTKLKQGRMWFVKTALPLPRADQSIDPKIAGKVLAGGLSAVIGPLGTLAAPALSGLFEDVIDKKQSEGLPYTVPKRDFRDLPSKRGHKTYVFLKAEFGYTTGDDKEPPKGWAWINSPGSASAYETREDAEAEAFKFVANCPWFIGKLEIVKIKLERSA